MSNLITEMLKITTLPLTMMQQIIGGAGANGQPGNGNRQATQTGAQMIQMLQSFCPYKLLDGIGPAQKPEHQEPPHNHGPGTSPQLPPVVSDPGPGPSSTSAGPVSSSANTGWGPMPSY